MAIYNVTYRILDSEGRGKSVTLLCDAVDEAALLVTADAMRAAIAGISQSGVDYYDYRRRVSVGEVPAAGSNVDAGMTFLWNTPLVIDPVTKIPDPTDIIKDGQGGIDLTDLNVVVFTELFTVGGWRVNQNTPTQPTGVRRATLDI